LEYDLIIVGGGMAGLTAGAFAVDAGYSVLICEKENQLGGLINSFDKNGFTFDSGIRAIENSGIVFPMLSSLGIEIEFVKSRVSVGIEDKVIAIISEENLKDYFELLVSFYPENSDDIKKIINNIKTVMKYMKVLYGIENPIFKDLKHDRNYLFKVFLPWIGKFFFTIGKINQMNMPVEKHLQMFTGNQSLIDIISQHFFKKTPAFFAMSYFSLYLDYNYPLGGTGMIPRRMEEFCVNRKAEIAKNTKIVALDPDHHSVTDEQGKVYYYKKLIWAADQKYLYQCIDMDKILDRKTKQKTMARKNEIKEKIGGDSVFTLYLAVDLTPSYFSKISNGHFFYSPLKTGLGEKIYSDLSQLLSVQSKTPTEKNLEEIKLWILKYINYTTFEISIPVLKDKNLAPAGKTGLILSVLFDYNLCKILDEQGFYNEIKVNIENCMIDTLSNSIYPGIRSAIIDRFSYSPLSIAKKTGSSEGAITGWAFTNKGMPAVNKMQNVSKSVLTPMSDIFQAGQWTYSPSGLPIAILTGKLAADQVISQLKKKK
jgi:phytoene dehydrogenase-like protein